MPAGSEGPGTSSATSFPAGIVLSGGSSAWEVSKEDSARRSLGWAAGVVVGTGCDCSDVSVMEAFAIGSAIFSAGGVARFSDDAIGLSYIIVLSVVWLSAPHVSDGYQRLVVSAGRLFVLHRIREEYFIVSDSGWSRGKVHKNLYSMGKKIF
jgi:hypothetical protein